MDVFATFFYLSFLKMFFTTVENVLLVAVQLPIILVETIDTQIRQKILEPNFRCL